MSGVCLWRPRINIVSKALTLLQRNATILPARQLSQFRSPPNGTLPRTHLSPQQGMYTQAEFSGYIPVDQLQIRYSRASGAGGQHVNKTNSRVEMRFKIDEADWIPAWIKDRLAVRESSKLTSNGFLIVTSEKTRKQILNHADCVDKIRRMIIEAARLPKEPTLEEIALRERRIKQAKLRRLLDRRHRSQVKQSRQAPSAADD